MTLHNSAALKKTADHVTMTYHKLLLCSTHGGASLSVLMGPDQKLHQAGNGTLLSERGVVGRAQCQVTDQPDGGLGENTGSVQC